MPAPCAGIPDSLHIGDDLLEGAVTPDGLG